MTASAEMGQIEVETLAQRLAAAEDLQLIDVREADELAIARLDGFDHLALSDFSQWAEQIQTRYDPEAETIVMCHHGFRSAQMCQWLISQGFTQVKNLVGGIDAYSCRVDPTVPRY
ncbi:MAG: rhodanese-like domain-containing protein [Almyronema sp.]